MSSKRIHFTHHARRQWRARFDDLGDAIEDEFAVAKPASKKVRQTLGRYAYRRLRIQRERGKRPVFYVTRRCVFPVVHETPHNLVVVTVYYRKRSV